MTSSDTNSSPQEHPMTDATPLASEQITQRASDAVHNLIVLCRLRFGNGDASANLAMEEGEWLLTRIAALSATPAPSGVVPMTEPNYTPQQAEDAGRRRALTEMVAMDEQMEAEHPGWMTGEATPAPSDQDASQAQGERLALEAIKAVTATTKDAVAGLSRIMAITRSAGVVEPYSELMAKPDVALIVNEPRTEWKHLFKRPAGCAIPPAGWRCTRTPGHDGPCAAVPAPGATAQDGDDGDCPEIPGSSTPTIPAGMVARKKIERAIADDVIREIYAREGWTRQDKGGFPTCTARAQSLYEITADPRRNRYVATPLAAAPKQAEQQGVERLIASARGHLLNVRAHGNAEANACMVFERVIDALAALNAPTGAVEKGETE